MKKTRIIAVDAGVNGAIAWEDIEFPPTFPLAGGRKVSISATTYCLPNVATFRWDGHRQAVEAATATELPWKAYIEKPPAFAGKHGVPESRIGKLFTSYGWLLGWFQCSAGDEAEKRVFTVDPRRWQSIYPSAKNLSYSERKTALVACARKAFPLRLVGRDEGDALCLLNFALKGQ